jgi:hypothetical protein
MLSCEKASQLNSEKMERQLSVSEKMTLRAHTMICKKCRAFEKNLVHLRAAMKKYNQRDD